MVINVNQRKFQCSEIMNEVVDQAFADLEQGAENLCKVIRQC